ncbi:MAG TPA: hypothetical protein VGP33_13980 [Chloroflexota bacterium]|nr:hypothetical protein [Chloroflexota bacterium]
MDVSPGGSLAFEFGLLWLQIPSVIVPPGPGRPPAPEIDVPEPGDVAPTSSPV